MIARRVAVAAAVLLGLAGCGRDSSNCDSNDDDDSRNGLSIGGLAVASNGLGYLTGYVGFATCSGEYLGGPRAFPVDIEARSADTVILQGIDAGKVLVRPDGTSGIVMAYRDAFGFGGPAPPGVIALDGSTEEIVNLGADALDIQPDESGFVVSAGAAGNWLVEPAVDLSLELSPLPSSCGAATDDRFLVCGNNEVLVLSSSGGSIASLPMTRPPTFLAGTLGIAIAIAGTNLAIIRADAVEDVVTLPDAPDYGWLSADGRFAVVRSVGSYQLIDLDQRLVQWNIETPSFPLTDAAFAGDAAIVTAGDGVTRFDFDRRNAEILAESSTGLLGLDQVEHVSGGTFVIATSRNYYSRFEPGDAARDAFRLYDLDAGFSDAWDLVIAE